MGTVVILDHSKGKTYLMPFNPEFDVQEDQEQSEAIEHMISNKGLSVGNCSYDFVDTVIIEII